MCKAFVIDDETADVMMSQHDSTGYVSNRTEIRQCHYK